MLYYLGNSDGWVCSDLGARTGITDKGNLSRTRKELENKGWITYSPTDKTITVHLDTLFQKTTSAKIAEMGLWVVRPRFTTYWKWIRSTGGAKNEFEISSKPAVLLFSILLLIM